MTGSLSCSNVRDNTYARETIILIMGEKSPIAFRVPRLLFSDACARARVNLGIEFLNYWREQCDSQSWSIVGKTVYQRRGYK